MKTDQERQFEELHKALEVRDEQIRTKDKKIEILEEKLEKLLELRESIVNLMVETDFGDPMDEVWREHINFKLEETDESSRTSATPS